MTIDKALSILGCKYDGEYICPEGYSHLYLEDMINVGLFGFCGCGMPDYEMKRFREVIHKIKKGEELLNEDQIYLYLLDKMEYTEHGSSIFGSWLNEKGEALLFLLDYWYDNERTPN